MHLMGAADLHLMPMRKANSKRPFPPWTRHLQPHFCRDIETTGSLLVLIPFYLSPFTWLPRKTLHSVLPGFRLVGGNRSYINPCQTKTLQSAPPNSVSHLLRTTPGQRASLCLRCDGRCLPSCYVVVGLGRVGDKNEEITADERTHLRNECAHL
jgi:hypothetical protein